MSDAVASVRSELSAPPSTFNVRTQAIETIKVGQRVLAKNPEVSSFERHTRGPEPNFANWLHLTLEMPKPDGSNLTINMLRSEEWLRNQIGYVVEEKSSPYGERLGLSKNPPSANQESGQPKAESRASESPTASLKAAQSVSPQTENLQPKTAADPDLWNFGIGHFPHVPLSPLRPIFTEILLTSLAVEEEGAELFGMTVQMDLPELGLTGEAILTDIRSAPAIEPPVDHLDTRQVVTATFHHSSGDVIDLVVADSRSFLPGRTFAAGEPQCRAVVPTAQSRNQGVNDSDNRSTEVTASREVLSGREDQQEAASDSPLSAFGSPLSPACEVGHSNHEPAESEEMIGTTSNHPFWSVDRQEFVQAGSLEIGERLQTLSGDVKVVQQKLPRPGPQPVFNLEVHYEHVYFVGEDGVLVHNAGPNGQYLVPESDRILTTRKHMDRVDEMVVTSKPSRQGKLSEIDHHYTNPGYHDTSNWGHTYRPDKSVLPSNLYSCSKKVPCTTKSQDTRKTAMETIIGFKAPSQEMGCVFTGAAKRTVLQEAVGARHLMQIKSRLRNGYSIDV